MKQILRALASYRAMAILLLLYAAAMGVATFIENRHGTPAARAWVYSNGWFYLLQLLLVVNFAGVAVRQRLVQQRKWATLVFHCAFAVILLGALVTHLTGREGIMHIREGESSNLVLDPQDPSQILEELPFSIALVDFRLVRYPGSHSPSSFESDVTLLQPGKVPRNELIYMNNVLHVGGYRLYQSSYDSDERGTILSVNHDPAGMYITYAGYILLMGGMLLSLFHKHSRFRTLSRQLSGKGIKAVAVLLLALAPVLLSAQTVQTHTHADGTVHEGPPHDMPQTHVHPDGTVHEGPPHDMHEQQPPRTLDRQREKRMAAVYAREMAVDPEVASDFGRLMVQGGQGRIEPVDTYASRLLRKIYRKESYEGLSADQVLLGIVVQPNVWSRVPFIRVGNETLREQAGGGNEKGYLAFIDVLDDNGDYIFSDRIEQVYAKPVRDRNKYDKELLKLDEKINILHTLFGGRMLPIFPHDGTIDNNNTWYSPGDDLSVFAGPDSLFVGHIFPWLGTEINVAAESGNWKTPREIVSMIATYQNARAKDQFSAGRIGAEMLYNRLNVFKWSGFLFMGFGLLLLLALIFRLVSDSRALKATVRVLTGAVVLVFLWQSFGIGLRWYIAGRPPVSNAYETMVFVGWTAAVAALLFGRRSRMAMALGIFLSGVLMFVSNLNWMDPEITPLVPVLKSPWLLIHVASITSSYAFFGIGFLLGFISLLMMALKTRRNAARLDGQIRELTLVNEMALIVGLVLLTAGTFLGAVWANESWGRYWGWDPKETWALVTLVVYAFVTHARFIPRLRSAYAFSVMSVVALGSVLMTFFGVNYYLSGMHSYGGDSAPPGLYAIWIVYGIAAVVALVAWQRNRTLTK